MINLSTFRECWNLNPGQLGLEANMLTIVLSCLPMVRKVSVGWMFRRPVSSSRVWKIVFETDFFPRIWFFVCVFLEFKWDFFDKLPDLYFFCKWKPALHFLQHLKISDGWEGPRKNYEKTKRGIFNLMKNVLAKTNWHEKLQTATIPLNITERTQLKLSLISI